MIARDLPGFRASQWCRAALLGDTAAKAWCIEKGVITKAQIEGLDVSGGYLVGDEMAASIIALREQYGVFRGNATVIPMSRDVLIAPRRTAGVTISYGSSEGSSLSESTASAYDSVTLTSKKLYVLVKMSSELIEDANADLGQFIAQDVAQGFAKAEDDAGWNGDGTSTYVGMRGITQLLIDGTHNAGKVAAASTHKTFTTLDGTDLANLMAALPAYAFPNSAFYISQFGFSTLMCRLAGGTGGGFLGTINGKPAWMGRPIVFAQSLPATNADNSTKIMVCFGDLSLSSLMGSARPMTLARSSQRYLEADVVAFRATQRYDIVNANLGDNTTAGPVVGLQGTA